MSNIINIAVVGAPGSGRTSLISKATELYAERPSGYTFQWHKVDHLDQLQGLKPDVVLNMVNAIDIERTLMTTAHLVERHLKIVMALSHYDEFLLSDHTLDYTTLGSLMGFKAMPIDALTGKGFNELLNTLEAVHEGREEMVKHVHVNYAKEIEHAIAAIVGQVAHIPNLPADCSKRHISVQLLENPRKASPIVTEADNYFAILEVAEEQRRKLEHQFGEAPEVLIQRAKEGFVAGVLQETLHHSAKDTDHTLTQKIDAVLTHRWLGFPILILVLFAMFEGTFVLGSYPQEWISSGVEALAAWIKGGVPDGWFTSLCVDGVLLGVGSVLSFLPNIIIMFFFLSMLEDCGYMSRAAFLMDKIMHRVGLHGRSFIPMLIGFGCNVPAIMAAREIHDWKDRALTMLMIPFMSCSARLPVYMLFVSAFFEVKYRAVIIMSLYVLGILLSILFAMVMKRTRWFRKKNEDYVSELPPYTLPTWRNTGAHIWERCWDYLQKIATVILWASMVIWALEYFPRNQELLAPIEQQIVLVEQDATLSPEERAHRLGDLERKRDLEQSEHSYLAAIGRFIEPVMKPLGFDWRLNVCLLTGLPAKEAIVSTVGILYSSDDGTVVETLKERSNITPLLAFSFMLFVQLYFPCIATLATLRREIGTRWAVFSLATCLVLAWLLSFGIFQIGTLL